MAGDGSTRLSELVETVTEEDAEAEEGDESGEEEGPQPVQLQELLHLMLGWLAETKSMYKKTRSEMLELRVDQMGGLEQAKDALEMLSKATPAPAPAETDGIDLSAWAAECAKLRDGLALAESKLTVLTKGREEAEQATAALRKELDEKAKENATLSSQLDAARSSHSIELAAAKEAAKEAADAAAQVKAQLEGDLRLERGAHTATTSSLHETEEARDAAMQEASQTGETLLALQSRHEKTVAELDELKGSVRVLCRLRPLKSAEGQTPSTKPAPNPLTDGGACRSVAVTPAANASARSYEFDRVFGESETTAALFEELRPLTRKVASGCAATILAYGQTGSGKTYTVDALHSLVVNELLTTSTDAAGRTPRLAVCMAEVYLDRVRDLAPDQPKLTPSASETALVSTSGSGGGPVFGEITLNWHYVHDANEAAAKVAAAAECRKTADNGLNAHSSRSHLVVVYALCGSGGERRGQIALVDLAGSERLARTEATGERRDEAVSINKSLSALGDVLNALIGKTEHVPYRNSKLTTLLQPCLRRGCRVAMILAASPSSDDAAETVQTLAFGARARSCALGPMAAVSAGGKGGGGEVARLQKQLLEAKQAATTQEKAAATAKLQAVAAEEKLTASAVSAKKAEARAKEAEMALERRTASAKTENSRAQKELADLQRKLDVAGRSKRANAAAPTEAKTPQATPASSARSQPAVAAAPKAAAPKTAAPKAAAPKAAAPKAAAPKAAAPETQQNTVAFETDGAALEAMLSAGDEAVPLASDVPAPSASKADSTETAATKPADAWPGELIRRLSNVMNNVAATSSAAASSSTVLSPLKPSQRNSSEPRKSASKKSSSLALSGAGEEAETVTTTEVKVELLSAEEEMAAAEAAVAAEAATAKESAPFSSPPSNTALLSTWAAAAEERDFSCRLSGVSDEGGSWLQPRLSLVRQASHEPSAFEIHIGSASEVAQEAAPVLESQVAAEKPQAQNRMDMCTDSFADMCKEMQELAKSPMPRLPTELIAEGVADTASTPTAKGGALTGGKKAVRVAKAGPSSKTPLLSKPPKRVAKTPAAAKNKKAANDQCPFAAAIGAAPLTCPARVHEAHDETARTTGTNKWQTSGRKLGLATPRSARERKPETRSAAKLGKDGALSQPRWQ